MTNKLPPYFEKYFEQKFDEVNENITTLTGTLGIVEKRISALEVWKAEIVGKLAVVSFVFVLTLNFIVDWFKKKFDL